ncbi:MAG: GspE/PulE family protein [bacterium]
MAKTVLDTLLQNKVITKDQFDQVMLQVNQTQKAAEQVVLDLKFAGEVDVTKAKSEAFNIPYVDLDEKDITNEILIILDANLQKAHNVVPFEITESSVKLAMTDPFDVPAIQVIERNLSGKKAEIFIAPPSQIRLVIDKRLGEAMETEVSKALEHVEKPITEIPDNIMLEDDLATLESAPVARIVNSIFQYGAKTNASDIHIEPLEARVRVRYRIHGVMAEKLKLPKGILSSVVARIKIMSNLKIDEKRIPQDGRLPLNVADKKFDVRVSTMPTIYGEKVVLRLLERLETAPFLEDTGLRGTGYKTFLEGLTISNGIILVTGPTGSGKTRTLAGSLGKLNKPGVNIITLEDPVEIRIEGTNQIQINPDAGLTFATGLRSVLRQDPDIVMVGEIRDEETAGLAVQAALTGHLVLATLHTNNAASALPRLLDMHIEPYLLASVMHTVVAQRLPRRICPHCKQAYIISPEVVKNIQDTLGNLSNFNLVDYLNKRCEAKIPADSEMNLGYEKVEMKCPEDKGNGQYDIYLYKGKGCDKCEGTGYTGRIGIFEVLKVTEVIGRMIMENKSDDEIGEEGKKNGMITMVQDGYLKALDGITTIEEVLRVSKD